MTGDEKISDAEKPLPATETPKSSNEEKSAANETEKPDDQTDQEKPQEIEKEGGDQPEESNPPPEIVYTLETAYDDIEHFLSNLPSALTEETPEDKKEEETTEKSAAAAEEVKAAGLEIPDFIEKYLDLIEEKLTNHESSAGTDTKLKGYQLPDDDPLFFKAVGQISRLFKNLSALIKLKSKDGALINRIGEMQHRAMCYLADEFKFLLEESRNVESDHKEEVPAPDQNTESNEDQSTEETQFAEYSDQVLRNMNKIAMEMISGGHELECCEVYMMVRRHLIGETLKSIGLEKISIDEAHKMQWELLERDIPPWITTFKQCANVHFPAERKLADTIFSGHRSLSDTIITSLVRCLFIQFLYFPEAVACCKLTTEKLFKFLDIYEALRDNLSPIDSIFPEQCARELRTEMTTCRCRIGEAAICIFCDLENSIMSDTGKTPVAGGAVHPLTRYIMNYLKYACEYKDTIEQVFKDHSKIERADSTSRPRNYVSKSEKYKKNDDGSDRSPYQEQLMRFMDLLDSAIEAKSKLYKDISLSCIFMMNNGRYMLQKIKGTAELYQVVGDNWCRNRSFDVRNYHKSYQRETWTKLLGCISNDGLTVKGKVVKPVLKEKFKSFNAMFDEIHRTQSMWVVYDEQLQSELRVSIASVVIPAYRSFLGRYSGFLDPGRQTEKYIKFQPEDIENYIDELFDGNPGRKHV